MARKMKVGMVGGGLDSFVGCIHRQAIEQSGCVELVCGAFGSTRQSSFETGRALQLPTRRAYGTYRDMFRREASLPEDERMDFVTILAPNTMHYPVAMSAIDASFPVLSEKPFTCNMDEALNLTRKQRGGNRPYGIAFAYAGYSVLRKARTLIQTDKALGSLRKVITAYPLGWMALRLETAGNKQAGWRTDPRRAGPSGCLIDLGVPCFQLTEWLTGLQVSEVCADARPTIPGRVLDDDASVLLRFEGGARGILLPSQISTGHTDGISVTVFGDKGALHWAQNDSTRLTLRGLDGSESVIQQDDTAEAPITAPESTIPSPYGNNPAYIAALAETYRSFAALLAGQKKAALRDGIFCFSEVNEGLRTVAFSDAVIKNTTSSEEGSNQQPKWTPLVVPPVPEL